MVATTDPRAAGFSATAFRDAINFTLSMANSNVTAERCLFHWETARTFGQADPAGNPYNWSATPSTTIARAPVEVPVAIEFGSLASARADTLEPGVGAFNSVDCTITLLDESYALVFDADFITVNERRYVINAWTPPIALFDVNVYQLVVRADDST
jgi:hypothetical protein